MLARAVAEAAALPKAAPTHAAPDGDAVDLYIEVDPGLVAMPAATPAARAAPTPAAGAMIELAPVPVHPLAHSSVPSPIEMAPGAGSGQPPHWPTGDAPGDAPRTLRLARLAPYLIVAVALVAGALVAGGSALWPRSTTTQRPAVPPSQPSAPLAPLPTVPTSEGPAAPAPRQAPGSRPGAGPATAPARAGTAAPDRNAPNAAAPRRTESVDAAADAALETAARLLANPPGAASANRARPPAGAAPASAPRR
jgi:hypothetical protein